RDPLDREILAALSGASQSYNYYDDTIPSECMLKPALQDVLLPKICSTGRCRLRISSPAHTIEEPQPLRWDEGGPWQFRLVIERQGENWIVRGILRRGEDQMDLTEPALLVEGGVMIARGAISRWNDGGAFAWVMLLKKERQIEVPVAHGSDLLAE